MEYINKYIHRVPHNALQHRNLTWPQYSIRKFPQVSRFPQLQGCAVLWHDPMSLTPQKPGTIQVISYLKYEVSGRFSVNCQAKLIYVVPLNTSVEHVTLCALCKRFLRCYALEIRNWTRRGGLRKGNTVIPRLTRIIRSGITFICRNLR